MKLAQRASRRDSDAGARSSSKCRRNPSFGAVSTPKGLSRTESRREPMLRRPFLAGRHVLAAITYKRVSRAPFSRQRGRLSSGCASNPRSGAVSRGCCNPGVAAVTDASGDCAVAPAMPATTVLVRYPYAQRLIFCRRICSRLRSVSYRLRVYRYYRETRL